MKTLPMACATAALILSFTLSLADAARAQNSPAPPSSNINSSAVIPMNHWEYKALHTIQQAGIAVADPKGSPIGQIPMTRHDFAEATARLLRVISTNFPDLAPQKKISEKIEVKRPVMDALLSLTDEFTPELKAMNVDVAGAKARLDAMEERLAVIEHELRRSSIIEPVNFISRGPIDTSKTSMPIGSKKANASGLNSH